MPNANKTLSQLRDEWVTCQACQLGERRIKKGGAFVFGEGEPGGIMLVGEGPGKDEEQEGRPFVGASGQLLRRCLKELGFTRYYISNVVACRSCAPDYNNEGQPIIFRGEHKEKDQVPPGPAVAACLPRLHEEIYLVDPVVIAGLGAEACKAMMRGSAIAIIEQSGKEREITVPGAAYAASLTAKRKLWLRKVKGEWRMPVVPTTVRYLLVPVPHPAYVLRKGADARRGEAMDSFLRSLKKVLDIYRFMETTWASTR